MAVFQLWNQNRFQNPIGISRDELMRISKISSTATFHKCIKELSTKGYVIYSPSFNPFKGSTLEVINLDYYTKPVKKKEVRKLKSLSKNEQVIEQVIEQVTKQDNEQALNKYQTSSKHVPYINNTNNINIVNEHNQKNEVENQKNLEIETLLDAVKNAKKKLREKKGTEQIPPNWEIVMAFFKDKQIPLIEGEKFYNHFQSNGWLVGGKSKMKDWKAAARNWIINAEKFTNKTRHPELVEGPKPNHLHTPNFKNYAEPL
jgi:hypothetical protein